MKIVLIDDSSTNLIILRTLCRKLPGAEPFAFTSSEAAIEYLMANDVGAIVVDYSMPQITGMELVKRMRTSHRHRHTPIIMVTGSTELAVRQRAQEVGVTQYLTKPVRAPEFIGCLDTLAVNDTHDHADLAPA